MSFGSHLPMSRIPFVWALATTQVHPLQTWRDTDVKLEERKKARRVDDQASLRSWCLWTTDSCLFLYRSFIGFVCLLFYSTVNQAKFTCFSLVTVLWQRYQNQPTSAFICSYLKAWSCIEGVRGALVDRSCLILTSYRVRSLTCAVRLRRRVFICIKTQLNASIKYLAMRCIDACACCFHAYLKRTHTDVPFHVEGLWRRGQAMVIRAARCVVEALEELCVCCM